MSEKNFKMTDHAIAHVAKLVQVAMLTGTDIVDHLRSLEFSLNESGDLVPAEKSLSMLGSEIESMFTEIENSIPEESENELRLESTSTSIFEA
jgi:hypothetical protein